MSPSAIIGRLGLASHNQLWHVIGRRTDGACGSRDPLSVVGDVWGSQ